MRKIWGIAQADFLERSRRFSFIAIIALAMFGSFSFAPNSDLNVLVVEPSIFLQGGHPSWIPVMSAWGITFFLPLLGFFYISNSLTFDEKTGVRQLIATSPCGVFSYLFGKFISNILLMYCIILAVFIGSIVMMLIHFPGQFISIYSIVSPYFVFLFSAVMVSALSILFESSRLLRKSLGAIIYVMLFFFLIYHVAHTNLIWIKMFDFTGINVQHRNVYHEVFVQSGKSLEVLKILAGPSASNYEGSNILIFNGIIWSISDIISLIGTIIVSLIIVVISVPIYKTMERFKWSPKRKKTRMNIESEYIPIHLDKYVPRKVSIKNNIIERLFSEIKLMLSGLPTIWWLISIGIVLICILAPLTIVQMMLPLVLLWLVSVYSSMGCREHIHDTLKYIAIVPNGLLRQIFLTWVSGIFISLVILSPVILRMALVGEYVGIFACISGAIFVPSLALFLGEWTQTSRAFEVVYVVLTYLSLNDVPEAGYLQVIPDLLSTSRALTYLTIAIIMAILAIVKRLSLIRKNIL